MITTEHHDGVYTVVLNYPAKMNCIGFEMLHGLEEAIATAYQDRTISVVLVRGAGDRAFSSGANTKEFAALSSDEVRQWIQLGHRLFNQLEQLPKPTVAYLRGYTLGGGLELALSCDFRLAHPTALLSNPELANGWLPGWGGMARLRRLVGEAHAKRVVLLSEKLNAETSLALGLITKIVSEDQAEAELTNFINQLKAIDSPTYALAKAALMDSTRTTTGSDVDFDVLAAQQIPAK